MNVLIVHCHPEPLSFNAALTEAAVEVCRARGDKVEVSDLYAENFDPVERAAHYRCRENAERFRPEIFQAAIQAMVEQAVA